MITHQFYLWQFYFENRTVSCNSDCNCRLHREQNASNKGADNTIDQSLYMYLHRVKTGYWADAVI